jgi:hypothetical protein
MSLRPPAAWFSGATALRDFIRWCSQTTVQLESYTVATLPSAADNARVMVYVSNETGGATMAFSDGTNWRRVQDRAIVS